MAQLGYLFVPVSVAVGSIAFSNYRARSDVKSNLADLKWMREHNFEMAKTTAECKLIALSINKQEEWLSSWNILKFPPWVKWADLPMDEEFLKRLNQKE